MDRIWEFITAARAAFEMVAGIFAGGIYEGADGSYVWEFLFVTVVIGGFAARATGRANAATWRPRRQTFFYVLLIGLAARFLHFALFQRTLLAPQYFIFDEIILQLIAAWSYSKTRAEQMATQYRWLFEKKGTLGWARRG